jgi:CMP-N,N'-diacetyllegionaminic acid synthase
MEEKIIIGIIPARAGSKRIPRKNVKLLKGKPLIVHTFDVAKQSKLLSEVIVSTNDQEVVDLAKKNGIKVPFIRPEEFADDHATDLDWITHALRELRSQNIIPDYLVILRPTQPLRKAEDIDQAITKMLKVKSHSVRSLTKVKDHPYWMKTLKGDFALPFIHTGKQDEQLRSQDLPDVYKLNGIVDVIDVDNVEFNMLYGKKMSYILLPASRSIDIDTLEDFEVAERLL